MGKDFRVAIALNSQMAGSIINKTDLDFLRSFAEVNPIEELPSEMTLEFMKGILKDADACITCWGTPPFTDELLDSLPKLRLIAHSAGSIKALVPKSFWKSGRRITSNSPVIAEDVAQTVLAFILCSTKGLIEFDKSTRNGEWAGGQSSVFTTRRLDDLDVGVVGASHVGKEIIKFLKPFNCIISVYDPFMTDVEAKFLGVKSVSLDELMAKSDIITLNAPAIENCRHMINAKNLSLIKDGALFINTARGMIVDEPALIKELATGRFSACIDVTDPEPPPVDHPFRKMDNVILTPHIAGGHTVNGRYMMGQNSIHEVYNYLHRGLLKHEVREEMLPLMA